MSPYSIQCKTCHARLKVRKAEAIGSIVNCPKCSAMVMISPPGPEGAPDPATESAISRRPVENTPEISEDSFSQIAEILDQPPPETQQFVGAAEDVGPNTAQSRPQPTDDLVRAAAEPPNRRWLFVGAGVAGALIAFVVFQSISGASSQQFADTQHGSPSEQATPVQYAVPEGESALAAQPESTISLPVSDRADRVTPTVDVRDDRAIQDDNSIVAIQEPNAITNERQDDLPSVRTPNEITVEIQTGREHRSREKLIAILREPLKLKCNQQEFCLFITTLEKLTGHPITVSGEAFARLRQAVKQGITIDSGDLPLGKAIQKALMPTGLKVSLQGDHVCIDCRESPQVDDERFAKHDVSDLVTQGDLVSLIQTFVDPDAWTTSGGEAEMALSERVLMVKGASSTLHHEVRLFCDQLRFHRGLDRLSGSGSQSEALPWMMARTSLAKKHTLQITDPVRLDEAFRRVAKMSNMYVWVNWQRLSSAGIEASDRIRVSAESHRLSEILDAICEELGAEPVIVGSDVVEITTREAASEVWETAFHRVDNLLVRSEKTSPDELIGSIYESIGHEWFSPGRGAIEFDAASRCMIVRLPQAQQIAVSRLLREFQA